MGVGYWVSYARACAWIGLTRIQRRPHPNFRVTDRGRERRSGKQFGMLPLVVFTVASCAVYDDHCVRGTTQHI